MKNSNLIFKFIVLLTFLLTFSDAKSQWFYEIDILPQNPDNKDSLNVRSVVGFNFGFGLSCPHVTYYNTSIEGSTIELDLFFDVSGAWTQANCYTIDTCNIGVYAPGEYSLNVSINKFAYGDTTFNTDTGTIDFIVTNSLSISEEEMNALFKIFPIPSDKLLTLDFPDFLIIKSLTFFDIQGKQILDFDPKSKRLNIAGINSGLYFLSIVTNKGSVKKKVLVK